MYKKIQLYIVSLWFLFFLLFLAKVEIPISFSANAKFIGIKKLIFDNQIPVFSTVLMVIGGVYYFSFNRSVTKGAPLLPKKITNLENINAETLSFLATYIIPLACVDLDKSRSLLILITVLVLIGCIYIKTNLFYTNPTLAVMGFKVYKLNTLQTEAIIVVTKNHLHLNDYIYPRQIEDNIYYAKKR
jgi:hypothetical protein